jgi:hypothetical protein
MIDQRSFLPTNQFNRDLYTDSQTTERVLNAAIAHAEISEGFDEYLTIFDAFYADDVEVSSDTREASIRGKASVRSLLFNFLVPLHVMAEIGGLSVATRETPIPGDVANDTHSAWTLDLVGASGTTCTLTWCTLRKWKGSHIIYEHHYDHKQFGGPLGFEDLSLVGPVTAGVRRFS